MTLERLNQHLALLEELMQAREMRQSFIQKAHPGAAALTGMPHTYGVADKVGDLAVEIADLDAVIANLEYGIQCSEREILPFIQYIRDNQTRMIFRLRFLRGLSWGEVADVIGGRNTTEGVKSACYRYLESCNAVTRIDAP